MQAFPVVAVLLASAASAQSPWRKSLLQPAIALLLATAATAQTSLFVGPGGFAEIQPAVAAAVPGDEIVVAPGAYASFWLDKGVTVRAQQAGTVDVAAGLFNFFAIPAGQTGHLVGLNTHLLWMLGGRLTLDQCNIENVNYAIQAFNSSVHLQSCELRALPGALVAFEAAAMLGNNSTITAIDSTFHGPSGALTARPAIQLINNSSLLGSGLTVNAGPGVPLVPALFADASSTVSLRDCQLNAHPSLCALSASNARCSECQLTGPCASFPGLVLGVERSTPLQVGQPFSLSYRTDAHGLVCVYGSLSLATGFATTIESAVLLDPNNVFPVAAMVANGMGVATGSWALPNAPIPPATALWFQGFSGATLPLAASPVAGGVVRP